MIRKLQRAIEIWRIEQEIKSAVRWVEGSESTAGADQLSKAIIRFRRNCLKDLEEEYKPGFARWIEVRPPRA
jgi:hypothetical protein